ncbi:unnamed protein product [Blepharisma stoltei]|uniref:Uncharacterized protein n=1 Tax=Blepharisma stoltei TaxID=1481888 RepID=A0AAU9JGL9_9CILI|nr:unnamed protein product [Blepharisma stoltei]
MELLNPNKFLGCLGSPYESVCECMTLKTAVIHLAIIDVIIGILRLLYLIMTLNGFFGHYISLVNISSSFIDIISIVCIVFAITGGISGMTKIKSEKIHQYSAFKIFEFIAITILTLIFSISQCYTIDGKCKDFGFLVFGLLFCRFVYMFAIKVIWSADVKMRSNEVILVLHGKDAPVYTLHAQQEIGTYQPPNAYEEIDL